MVIVISGGEYSERLEHWDEAERIYEGRTEEMAREEVLLGLCGFTRITIDLEVDAGDAFPCSSEDVEKFAEQLMGMNHAV